MMLDVGLDRRRITRGRQSVQILKIARTKSIREMK